MTENKVIMDFSGIYREEGYSFGSSCTWLDFRNLQGVNGYCEPRAMEEIREKIQELSYEGIHFLDSGNYHYLSKFWLEKIEEPFSLLVFDNHTDMQEAAFFGLLSCGSWVKDQLDTNDFLKEVCVLGPSRQAFEECSREDRRRIREIPAEESEKAKLLEDFLERNSQLPLYLSIDKDLLSTEAARTNWDQGEISLSSLLSWIRQAFEKRYILGADICGENPQDTQEPPRREDLEINGRTNRTLLELLEHEMGSQKEKAEKNRSYT